jgi:hypothetical protein
MIKRSFVYLNLKIAMVFLSYLFSCSSNTDYKTSSSDFFELGIENVILDTMNLAIDSLTTIPENSQLIRNDSVFFFYNKSNLSLEFYHRFDSISFNRVFLESEGPNGLSGMNGVYYISNDTIIGSRVNELILFNIKGKIYKRIKLNLDGLGSFPDLMIQGTKPIVFFEDKLIISIFPHLNPNNKSHLENWKSFVEIDLNSGIAKSFGELPQVMKDFVFGINYLNFSFVKNSEDELIISFAPINDLFSIDLNDPDRNLDRIILKDPNFNSAPPLSDPKNSDMQYVLSHYLFNNSFDAIYYNGTNYIRIIQKPISEDEFNSMSWAKRKVMIWYDLNFVPVLSHDLNSRSLSYNMVYPLDSAFISRVSSSMEDNFQFVLFKN